MFPLFVPGSVFPLPRSLPAMRGSGGGLPAVAAGCPVVFRAAVVSPGGRNLLVTVDVPGVWFSRRFKVALG